MSADKQKGSQENLLLFVYNQQIEVLFTFLFPVMTEQLGIIFNNCEAKSNGNNELAIQRLISTLTAYEFESFKCTEITKQLVMENPFLPDLTSDTFSLYRKVILSVRQVNDQICEDNDQEHKTKKFIDFLCTTLNIFKQEVIYHVTLFQNGLQLSEMYKVRKELKSVAKKSMITAIQMLSDVHTEALNFKFHFQEEEEDEEEKQRQQIQNNDILPQLQILTETIAASAQQNDIFYNTLSEMISNMSKRDDIRNELMLNNNHIQEKIGESMINGFNQLKTHLGTLQNQNSQTNEFLSRMQESMSTSLNELKMCTTRLQNIETRSERQWQALQELKSIMFTQNHLIEKLSFDNTTTNNQEKLNVNSSNSGTKHIEEAKLEIEEKENDSQPIQQKKMIPNINFSKTLPVPIYQPAPLPQTLTSIDHQNNLNDQGEGIPPLN